MEPLEAVVIVALAITTALALIQGLKLGVRHGTLFAAGALQTVLILAILDKLNTKDIRVLLVLIITGILMGGRSGR